MSRSIVAIVGRANVGKSTLFNRIVRKQSAVIEDFPGITRDRIYGDAVWEEKHFLVVDTGGFLHEPNEEIYREVKNQVLFAIEEADIIVMLMDADSGVLPQDVELIDNLRKYGKNIFYAVNKIDGKRKEKALYDFYSLGVDLVPLSAKNGNGYDELMEKIVSLLPETGEEICEYPRIAIVGRPNVGKSTLVNGLLSKDRMIVSPVAGTTRDAVDSICTYYSRKYVLVDTAGVRRKGKMAKTVEKYSFIRTLRNIEDSDISIIVLDATSGVVELDQKIAGCVIEARKPAIVLVNKWDLIDKEKVSVEDMINQARQKLWFMRYVPVLTISAMNKQRVTKLFPLVDKVIAESEKRISTHELNTFLSDTLAKKEPKLYKNRRVKLYYITQVKTKPPGFVLFTNKKAGINQQYRKFLENQLRERFSFEGVTIDLYIKQRDRKS
jgi:GTP-binding protein